MVKKRKQQAQPGTGVTDVKPNPKQKQAQTDKVTPVAKRTKPKRTPPLKLNYEVVLSPTVLAHIAEHIEALLLKQMMKNLHQTD